MTNLIPVVRGKETSHMTILSQLKESWLEYLKIFTTYMKPYKSYLVIHSNIAFCFKVYTFASKCIIGLFLPVNCSYLLLMSCFNYYGGFLSLAFNAHFRYLSKRLYCILHT